MADRKSWGRRDQANRLSARRRRLNFPVRGEQLEERRMLAAVVTAASAGAFSALAAYLDTFVDIGQILPPTAQQRLGSDLGTGETLTYQAYAGEVNDVSISQQFGDLFYVVNEGNSLLPVIPVPLAFNPKVLNDLGVGFSFVVEVTIDIGDGINLPDATAIVPNATSILEMIPGIGGPDGILAEMANIYGEGLTFGLGEIVSFLGEGVGFIQDAINTAIGPIVSVVGDVVHAACQAIDAIPFVDPDCDDVTNFSKTLLTSLADNLNPLPEIPTAMLNLGTALLEGLTSTFTTESVVVSTLDGPDNIDLGTLRGVDQYVYAGSQDDVIRGGGGDADVKLYGEEGRDTFVLNLVVDVPNYFVDGGDGNDILSILGTDGNDTIRLISSGGKLQRVLLEAPNPQSGQTANEIQKITLPASVTGGDFVLTYQGNSTTPISSTAGGGDVQAALVALGGLSSGDVSVSGGIGGPYTVTFGGSLANQDIGMITADGSGLVVSGGSMTASTIREADPNQGTNEKQTIEIPPLADGGSFTLSFNGSGASVPIPFDAPASKVLQALSDLSTMPAGGVDVTGQPGGPWTVEFQGTLGASDQPAIVANGTALTSSVAGNVVQIQTAVRATNEIQRISIPAAATGGTFRLTFDGDTTAPIPTNATVSQVQAALHALSSIGNPGNIIVTGSTGGPWDVEFTNQLRGRDQSLITTLNNDLRGGVILDVAEVVDGSGTNEIHSISTNGATAGTFTLTFDNGSFARTTAALPYDATPGEIQSALEALTSVGAGNVQVTGPVGGPWQIEYVADFAAADQVLIRLDGSNLNAGFVTFSSSVVETTGGGGGNDEVQTVTITPSGGSTTGGTFTLHIDSPQTGSITTAPIPYDADGAAVEAALAAAGLTQVSVTGLSQGPYVFTFGGTLADTSIPTLFSPDTSRLSGNSGEVQAAVSGANEVQQITPSVATTGGDFTLSFQGATTPPLPYNATAGQVASALQALPTIGAGNVIVSGPSGGAWTIEFTEGLAKTSVDLITANATNLAGALSVNVTDNFQAAVAGTNERQSISLSPDPTSGNFRLSYNGATTGPLNHQATALAVQNALRALPTIGAGNVVVTGADGGPWTVEFVEALRSENRASITVDTSGLVRSGLTVNVADATSASGTNEQQRIALPFGVTSGDFTLTFDGETTSSIDFAASRVDVQTALEALTTIGAGNVKVFGPQKGPWTIEFTGALAETDQSLIQPDGANLVVDGGPVVINETTKGNDGAANVVIATTTFKELISVEQIQIAAGGGDDTIIIEGDTGIAQILVDGGDGTDVLELVSDANNPTFVAPIFPDGTQATLEMDSQTVEFAAVEGGIVFDASGQAGDVTVSGTDAANDIRFQGTGSGAATFANDGQVTISLRNFAAASSVTISGNQGDDTISVAPNGVSEFAQFTITGDGPAGADSVRFEGTPDVLGSGGLDDFTYTPSPTAAEDGRVTYNLGGGDLVTLDFAGFGAVAFIGLGGTDKLTVNEPLAGSRDTVLFNPEVGNNGSFQFVSQSAGPATAVVYSSVSYQSIELRDFNTGTGVDTFSLSSNNLPGVNSTASVVGGNAGVTTAMFGDQSTTFTHDVDLINPDILTFEIGTANDVVSVTPGRGISIVVNTALGDDRLQYNAAVGDITLDTASSTISQPGLGDVQFTNAETVQLTGNGANGLAVLGAALENRYRYAPLTAQGGRFLSDQTETAFVFAAIGGTFSLGGGTSPRDSVVVEGSAGPDRMFADGPGRTIHTTDSAGTFLKAVLLAADIESISLDAGAGDDLLRILPAGDLFIHVDGSAPNASDRLLVEDAGIGDLVLHREASDGRSGSVTVGGLLPVDYVNIERVDILPLNPTTGGTGIDGLGRLVVFDADPFEQNESLPNRSDFPALFEIPVNPNIDPGAAAGVFPNGPDLPGDEDWYRFDAATTATLRFELVFDPIGTLANGNPGLPGDGQLQIEVYDPNHNLISKFGGEGAATHTVGVEGNKTYSLRVRGVTPQAINNYDIRVVNLDEIGPQVTDLFITDDAGTGRDESAYDLFDLKPIQGPTPLVRSLTIKIRDLSERFPGFLYDALDSEIAAALGQYQVVGDHNGIISIGSVEVINDPVVVGENATASIVLHFTEPLPDDRFTLTVRDNLVDPVGNRLDGESNASEPQENPLFPSGDSVSQGNFIARFTVDSRAEIGTWAAGSAYIDTNGNFLWDPESQFSDDTNEDIVYKLGFQTDNVFAGNFVTDPLAAADGFDKLATYGQFAGVFRWLIDTNNNGIPDLVVADPAGINGRPLAGNFDGNTANGDEVGLKDGNRWYLDTNHDFTVDTVIGGNLIGLPVVGDFDGDGIDDLGAWADDLFSLDLSSDGIDGQLDASFTFGFPSVRELPFAADFNGDGVDDLGLWNPDASGLAPGEHGEWYVLMSQMLPNPVLKSGPITLQGSETVSTIAANGHFLADDFIAVDPARRYRLSAEARSGDDLGGQYQPGNQQYFGFASYDSDQHQITPFHVMKHASAVDTRLAATLNPGDTTIQVVDATGWANAGAAHQRALAWYGYANSDGYVYPDYTYTRNVKFNYNQGLWNAGAITGNVITLNAPWNGPKIEAGMAVRNATAGPNLNYAMGRSVPDQWTNYGMDVTGTGVAPDQFRPGTAFIKPVVLTNYQAGANNLIRWRDVDFQFADVPVVPITDRITPAVNGTHGNVIHFTPVPFGPDLYASFGDAYGLPVVGNFDPPVVPGATPTVEPVSVVGLRVTNPTNAYDVDGNGLVTPLDALLVVNYLNRNGGGYLAEGLSIEASGIQRNLGAMVDVNGDGMVSPLDALRVVNHLNRDGAAGVLSGEGEGSFAFPPLETTADLFIGEFERAGEELAILRSTPRQTNEQSIEQAFAQWAQNRTPHGDRFDDGFGEDDDDARNRESSLTAWDPNLLRPSAASR